MIREDKLRKKCIDIIQRSTPEEEKDWDYFSCLELLDWMGIMTERGYGLYYYHKNGFTPAKDIEQKLNPGAVEIRSSLPKDEVVRKTLAMLVNDGRISVTGAITNQDIINWLESK